MVSRLGASSAAPAVCGESHAFARELVRVRLHDSQSVGWEGSYDRDDPCCMGFAIVNENGHEAQPLSGLTPSSCRSASRALRSTGGHWPVISAFGTPDVTEPSVSSRWSSTTVRTVVTCRYRPACQ